MSPASLVLNTSTIELVGLAFILKVNFLVAIRQKYIMGISITNLKDEVI